MFATVIVCVVERHRRRDTRGRTTRSNGCRPARPATRWPRRCALGVGAGLALPMTIATIAAHDDARSRSAAARTVRLSVIAGTPSSRPQRRGPRLRHHSTDGRAIHSSSSTARRTGGGGRPRTTGRPCPGCATSNPFVHPNASLRAARARRRRVACQPELADSAQSNVPGPAGSDPRRGPLTAFAVGKRGRVARPRADPGCRPARRCPAGRSRARAATPGSRRRPRRARCATPRGRAARRATSAERGSGRPRAPESGRGACDQRDVAHAGRAEQVSEPDRVLILDERDRVPEHAFRVLRAGPTTPARRPAPGG